MKIVRRVLLGLGIVASLSLGRAQTDTSPSPTDMQAALAAIESTTPYPASAAPRGGNFYSAQFADKYPPMPFDFMNLPFWSIGGGYYIYDDRDVDYAALRAAAEEEAAAHPNTRVSMMASSLLNTSFAYGNPVYLTNMAATFGGSATTASFSIAGGTNFVPYDILTSTNVANSLSNWTWLGIGYTSNNYTFSNQPVDQSYYILARPHNTMVVGWGADGAAQCNVPSGLTNALMVAGGSGQSLALLTNGTVVAWGLNNAGQGVVPTNLAGVTMIAAGWYHDLALLTNGTVIGWGMHTPFDVADVPTNLANVTVISAQAYHSLALMSNGTVAAWGYNLGYGETNVPVGLTNVVAISAGYAHNLAALSNGTVVAWGNNSYGQTNVPTGLSNVVDVEAGVYHSLALRNNGTVVAWGDNTVGETNVPFGLTNVVAIAAGGDPLDGGAYSLALISDGTVVAWGEGQPLDWVQGMSNVFAIAAGADHALAIRTGPRTPVITLEPADQYQIQGGNVSFTARGSGLYGVTYQWQTNGVNLTGATNATLTLTNVQAAQLVNYDVVVTDNGGMGSIVSSNANLYFVTSPVVNSESLPTNQFVVYQSSVTLNVGATAPGEFDGFPLSYQWQFDGTNLTGQTASNYTFTAINSGTYSVTITNVAGSTNVSWQVTVVYPGGIIPWGTNAHGEENVPLVTNALALAAGKAHGIAALDNGSVTNWGSYWTGTSFTSVATPPLLTNAVGVAAGSRHDVALKADGTVIAWGSNDVGQTNVPANATNIIAIAAGGNQTLALKQDGTVVQWGQTNGPILTGLTNVTAIASGTNFSLALLQNSTVVVWGTNDFGQTNIPTGLSNVVAIAAGGSHALALKQDGTVVPWGSLTNIPANLTNAMNVAAGENQNIALKNDSTVIAWGDNTFGQTNVPNGLTGVKLIAGGGYFSVAALFSTLVQYPVNVANDLLLIYNTGSTDSLTVVNYYLANRPGVSNANVLGFGFTNIVGIGSTNLSTTTNYYETISTSALTNTIFAPIQSWLAANPTKRPQYVILFLDMPSRVVDPQWDYFPAGGSYPQGPGVAEYSSIQVQINTSCLPRWNPFVTSINMNGTNDCIGYINKLKNFDAGNSLFISASAQGYGNTNYAVDSVRHGTGYPPNEDFSPYVPVVSVATNGLIQAGVSTSSIIYTNGLDTITGTNVFNAPQITNASNLAGYISWGSHSALGAFYAKDGTIHWNGNSSWYIMETIESFNGRRYEPDQGIFLYWFASGGFGGTNYSNTPIAAVTHVDEPFLGNNNDPVIYFGLWAGGKSFPICAWNSRRTPYFQAVGDPFITK